MLLFIFLTNLFAITEHRTRVVVVDSGLNYSKEHSKFLCSYGHKDFTYDKDAFVDKLGHGTSIFDLIIERINPKTHCITVLKYTTKTDYPLTIDRSVEAFKYTKQLNNVKYVNFSSSGIGFRVSEFFELFKLTRSRIYVIVAAGNDGLDLSQGCIAYPACHKMLNNYYFRVVTSKNSPKANYGLEDLIVEDGIDRKNGMLGTSQATARYTGKLVAGVVR